MPQHCKFRCLFPKAADIFTLPRAKFIEDYRGNAINHGLVLVALDGGEVADLIDVIDLNVSYVTSKYLSAPRLVRDIDAHSSPELPLVIDKTTRPLRTALVMFFICYG